jgi:hypothetical protein
VGKGTEKDEPAAEDTDNNVKVCDGPKIRRHLGIVHIYLLSDVNKAE